MKNIWKIIIGVIIIVIVISTSFFIYNALFGMSHCTPRKQIAFVNCTYYIYPNGTYAVVNVTKVIPLQNVELKMEYFELRPVVHGDWKNETIKVQVNDKNGLLDVGDQFFIFVSGGKITELILVCGYHSKNFDGMGYLWGSKHGPYVWKEEE